jgi:hypothetical protein
MTQNDVVGWARLALAGSGNDLAKTDIGNNSARTTANGSNQRKHGNQALHQRVAPRYFHRAS